MSSISTQVFPSTSPMMFITSDSPARSRRLSTIASGALLSRLASPRARTTPPTSGETTISSRLPKRAWMSVAITGEANRLSVGMSKKPWICPAWRSIDRTRFAPAVVIRLATSLAEIGVRGPRFPVLPRIAEIGKDGGDPFGRRAPQRVDADQELHQIVVRRIAGRLDHEHVLAADVLVDLDEHFFVGEAAHARVGQRRLRDSRRSIGPAAGCCSRRAISCARCPLRRLGFSERVAVA